MTEFELEGESKTEIVQSAYMKYGNERSLRRFTQDCIDSELFDADQIDGFAMSGAMRFVGNILKAKDSRGRPFALPYEKGRTARWKQYSWFGVEDFAFAIAERVNNAAGNLDEARMMHDDCMEKFGTAPFVPRLSEG